VRDNTGRVFPLCSISHQPIWAGARSDKFTRRSSDPLGLKRRQLARQVGACYVLTNTFPLSPRWVVFSNLFSLGWCSALGVSSSCPSTAATTWYSSPRNATAISAVVSSPGGGELDDVFPPVAKEQHPGLSRHPPRRRRRRRGNRGQAGGGTLSAVGPERVDDAGTPAGDMSGVVLVPETTTDVVSPQRANPKRTDDASTLAKDLLGVSFIPEMTVQFAPDATSPPSIDQEVPSVFHSVPFRFNFDPPSDPASVSAFVKAYPNLLGYHMWSSWDRLTAVSTYRPPGSEEEDGLDSGWDFSELCDPRTMRDFMIACDYYLSGCSDDGHNPDNEGCGPSRECFHVNLGVATKATTSVCRRMTIPLGLLLALTSHGS
jgi:hypothetical protein